ncbi:hypothetical protein AYI68_g1858 [Smittium mucronatum]|uniref:Uncharacterized protein n=1 Tax=Smittium mucronatum TaxID=133383 RepID=A0A1R0H480_9FUNG|nr:hypothetical protein AYI68_g1858 [Smittium mucronatum]
MTTITDSEEFSIILLSPLFSNSIIFNTVVSELEINGLSILDKRVVWLSLQNLLDLYSKSTSEENLSLIISRYSTGPCIALKVTGESPVFTVTMSMSSVDFLKDVVEKYPIFDHFIEYSTIDFYLFTSEPENSSHESNCIFNRNVLDLGVYDFVSKSFYFDSVVQDSQLIIISELQNIHLSPINEILFSNGLNVKFKETHRILENDSRISELVTKDNVIIQGKDDFENLFIHVYEISGISSYSKLRILINPKILGLKEKNISKSQSKDVTIILIPGKYSENLALVSAIDSIKPNNLNNDSQHIKLNSIKLIQHRNDANNNVLNIGTNQDIVLENDTSVSKSLLVVSSLIYDKISSRISQLLDSFHFNVITIEHITFNEESLSKIFEPEINISYQIKSELFIGRKSVAILLEKDHAVMECKKMISNLSPLITEIIGPKLRVSELLPFINPVELLFSSNTDLDSVFASKFISSLNDSKQFINDDILKTPVQEDFQQTINPSEKDNILAKISASSDNLLEDSKNPLSLKASIKDVTLDNMPSDSSQLESDPQSHDSMPFTDEKSDLRDEKKDESIIISPEIELPTIKPNCLENEDQSCVNQNVQDKNGTIGPNQVDNLNLKTEIVLQQDSVPSSEIEPMVNSAVSDERNKPIEGSFNFNQLGSNDFSVKNTHNITEDKSDKIDPNMESLEFNDEIHAVNTIQVNKKKDSNSELIASISNNNGHSESSTGDYNLESSEFSVVGGSHLSPLDEGIVSRIDSDTPSPTVNNDCTQSKDAPNHIISDPIISDVLSPDSFSKSSLNTENMSDTHLYQNLSPGNSLNSSDPLLISGSSVSFHSNSSEFGGESLSTHSSLKPSIVSKFINKFDKAASSDLENNIDYSKSIKPDPSYSVLSEKTDPENTIILSDKASLPDHPIYIHPEISVFKLNGSKNDNESKISHSPNNSDLSSLSQNIDELSISNSAKKIGIPSTPVLPISNKILKSPFFIYDNNLHKEADTKDCSSENRTNGINKSKPITPFNSEEPIEKEIKKTSLLEKLIDGAPTTDQIINKSTNQVSYLEPGINNNDDLNAIASEFSKSNNVHSPEKAPQAVDTIDNLSDKNIDPEKLNHEAIAFIDPNLDESLPKKSDLELCKEPPMEHPLRNQSLKNALKVHDKPSLHKKSSDYNLNHKTPINKLSGSPSIPKNSNASRSGPSFFKPTASSIAKINDSLRVKTSENRKVSVETKAPLKQVTHPNRTTSVSNISKTHNQSINVSCPEKCDTATVRKVSRKPPIPTFGRSSAIKKTPSNQQPISNLESVTTVRTKKPPLPSEARGNIIKSPQ